MCLPPTAVCCPWCLDLLMLGLIGNELCVLREWHVCLFSNTRFFDISFSPSMALMGAFSVEILISPFTFRRCLGYLQRNLSLVSVCYQCIIHSVWIKASKLLFLMFYPLWIRVDWWQFLGGIRIECETGQFFKRNSEIVEEGLFDFKGSLMTGLVKMSESLSLFRWVGDDGCSFPFSA